MSPRVPNPGNKNTDDEEASPLVLAQPCAPLRAQAERETDAAAFEELWRQFPKRIGKVKARKAWEKALAAGHAAEDILAGVLRYAVVCEAKEDRFIKEPANWLSEERWTDEYAPNGHSGITGGPGSRPMTSAEVLYAMRNRNLGSADDE